MASARWTSVVLLVAGGCLTAATCQDGSALAQSVPDPKVALTLSGVPGMDFSALSGPAQRELATVFSDEFCYCGCPHALGACLKQHTACKHSRRMALLAAGEASGGTPAVEIILALSKYYQSFPDKRASFKLDERMCMGPKDAPVTLVEFSDFECPFCNLARPMLEEFVKGRKNVRLCFGPFPLAGHANAIPAGQAALFARDKGKFWAMHDALFENQLSLSPGEIKRLAAGLGLDPAELGKAMDSGRYVDELNASKEAAKAAGVDSTPSLFVNGRRLKLGMSPTILEHTVFDELEWMANKGAWTAD
ncbi:MAG: DsbA family protein [Myxococcaceae bacterium]